ncbi:MAG: hypothetical protein PVH31_04325 [Ectothiorhodospiraceae bacterium]|jgi:hypothetical protein
MRIDGLGSLLAGSLLLVLYAASQASAAALEDFAAPFMDLRPVQGKVPLLVVLMGADDPEDAPSSSARNIRDKVFGPATVRSPDGIVGLAIAKSSKDDYAWYDDGTVSSGSPTRMMASRAPYAYSLPPGKTPRDIVGVGIAGTGDRVYAWYRDGEVSAGNSRDLDAAVSPYPYTLPAGKSPKNIVAMAIAANDRVHAWYDDGTMSVGTSSDLDAYQAPAAYTLPERVTPSQIVGIGLTSASQTFAWTRRGTVSAGTPKDLDHFMEPRRYSIRQKTVQSYFEEVSRGAFGYTEAGVIGWLKAKDDPGTSGVDESSHAFIYGADEKGKGAWLIQEIERRTAFRFADYDINPRDGRVTERELAILWVYPGGSGARGRETEPTLVPVPSLTQGVEIGYLVRGSENMSWATMAHELSHQTLHLPDLYPADGTVSGGKSWDLDELRGLYGFGIPGNRLPRQIAALGIAGSNDWVYAWYRDGFVSAGTSDNLAHRRQPRRFTLPPGLSSADIVAGAIAGSNDRVYMWYANGTVSSGNSTDLDLYRPPQPFSLPPGKDIKDIAGIAIAGSDDRVFAWYSDGTVSIGSTRDLDHHRSPYPFRTPPGVASRDIIDAAIAKDDTVYAWYSHRYAGVGPFSLMGNEADGSHLDPWLKMKLGWLKPAIANRDGWYLLPPVESQDGAVILHDPHHGTGEYFIVENRWPPGSHEDNTADAGLAIWHIDEAYTGYYTKRDRKPGDWGRNTAKLVYAGGEPPTGSHSEALWDGSDSATGYSATPTSRPGRLRWTNGSSSDIGVWFIPAAGPEAQVYLDLPPLQRSDLPQSAMQIACTAPPVILAGKHGEIRVIALTGHGRRLPGAQVALSAGGGLFEGPGDRKISGTTDSAGMFRATWHTPGRSAFTGDLKYRFSVSASKAGYSAGNADCITHVLLNPP